MGNESWVVPQVGPEWQQPPLNRRDSHYSMQRQNKDSISINPARGPFSTHGARKTRLLGSRTFVVAVRVLPPCKPLLELGPHGVHVHDRADDGRSTPRARARARVDGEARGRLHVPSTAKVGRTIVV